MYYSWSSGLTLALRTRVFSILLSLFLRDCREVEYIFSKFHSSSTLDIKICCHNFTSCQPGERLTLIAVTLVRLPRNSLNSANDASTKTFCKTFAFRFGKFIYVCCRWKFSVRRTRIFQTNTRFSTLVVRGRNFNSTRNIICSLYTTHSLLRREPTASPPPRQGNVCLNISQSMRLLPRIVCGCRYWFSWLRGGSYQRDERKCDGASCKWVSKNFASKPRHRVDFITPHIKMLLTSSPLSSWSMSNMSSWNLRHTKVPWVEAFYQVFLLCFVVSEWAGVGKGEHE